MFEKNDPIASDLSYYIHLVFQIRHMSGSRSFIKQFIENIQQDMAKNKEMKVRCTDWYSWFASVNWLMHTWYLKSSIIILVSHDFVDQNLMTRWCWILFSYASFHYLSGQLEEVSRRKEQIWAVWSAEGCQKKIC